MSERIVVIIPVYKTQPSAMEIVSLRQCRKVLLNYDVYLIAPQGLDCSAYRQEYPELQMQEVPAYWLGSIEAYNRMKRTLAFYMLFEAYTFMLTYELDSYIFSDNWAIAKTFSYDYIGAPWFEGWLKADRNSKLKEVGNSGFSMRNVQKCIKVLQAVEMLRPRWGLFRSMLLYKIFQFSKLAHLYNPFWKKDTPNPYFFTTYGNWHANEDEFWGGIAPRMFEFEVATIDDAIRFSFEVNPSILYGHNHHQLPLGCHAWERHDPEFWKHYIYTEVS